MSVDLRQASLEFAQKTQDLLDSVLPVGAAEDLALRWLKVIEHGDSFVIRPGDAKAPAPIWLLKNGDRVANLELLYHCEVDQSRDYLAVRKSKFQLTSERPKERPPLLRLDYDYKLHSVPHAHWNVHGERGATSVLLSRCNPDHDGLLSQVHLPVGGVRYRPCLEDFLELLLSEFKFDTVPGWAKAIADGRETWRKLQTRAIVRDAPQEAAEVLSSLGYSVQPPTDGHRANNLDMLRGR